jgi:hypothetical protein
MSSPDFVENPPPVPGDSDNRRHARKAGKASVVVTRESDGRQILVPVHMADISVGGIGLVTVEPLVSGDRVKVQLRNDVRKFVKQVHGIVRWTKPLPDGSIQVGIGLNVWFNFRDMQLMTQSGFNSPPGEKIWV